MSNDGSNVCDAERALATILGGEPAPTTEPTREEVRARVMAAPYPLTTKPTTYGEAADTIARAYLALVDEGHVDLLDPGADWWRAITLRWDGFDEWLGGATGYMVGFAGNVVRWLHERPREPNPAIVPLGGR